MTQYFAAIEIWFQGFAASVPLSWFVFAGSALEEIFSIIPGSLVTGLAGSLALAKNYEMPYLILLAFIGSAGRMIGVYIYYWLGDKLEDILVPYSKKFFGVGHKEIEGIGKRFNGKHFRDVFVLFCLRVTPFFPVTVTSIACGVIKMNLKVYLTASFLGNFVKDFMFLVIGYIGLASLARLWRPILDYKWYVDIIVFVIIGTFFIWLYLHRGQGKRFIKCLHQTFKKK